MEFAEELAERMRKFKGDSAGIEASLLQKGRYLIFAKHSLKAS
jgi:hypothetical protein